MFMGKTSLFFHFNSIFGDSVLFYYFIYLFIFLFVVNFVIHWNEAAMGLHVFPIPIPPPTSVLLQQEIILSNPRMGKLLNSMKWVNLFRIA